MNEEEIRQEAGRQREKDNLNESLRVQKAEWVKEQIRRQRETEDAVLEQMMQEQEVIDRLHADINENLDRTKESRKFNRDFQEKINAQIYEMNGVSEDTLKGMREYKNAWYQGCAFSLFFLSIAMIVICGVLHGFEAQICLFMIACTGGEGTLLAQGRQQKPLIRFFCKLLYLLIFPVMMVAFVCFELKYPEYDLFLPYFALGIVGILMIGAAAFFLFDPYKEDKKRVKNARDYITDVEKIARKEVRKNQKQREKEERKNLKTAAKEERQKQKEEERTKTQETVRQKAEEEKAEKEKKREEKKRKLAEKKMAWSEKIREWWDNIRNWFLQKIRKAPEEEAETEASETDVAEAEYQKEPVEAEQMTDKETDMAEAGTVTTENSGQSTETGDA